MSAGRLTALTLFLLLSLLPGMWALAQEAEVARLVHPEVAERLSLDDTQRASIQRLLLDRAQAVAAVTDSSPAAAATREAVKEKFRQDILAVLTPEQQALWAAPQPTQKLMFQFREMKWEDVLNWFASQQDLTLVMDRSPGGTFTYSDTRTYSPSEGIDLLNSVLMTRGFTLVRREKMLMVMELNDSIPLELLPRVPLEELDQRGRFEIVSVLFPLDGRPVDAVLQEVKPYLSSYGRTIPLARGGQLLAVETAGKMRTINELIASVPLPKTAPKPDKPETPPKPVFAAYPLGELDSGAVLETIRKLIPSEQITVDGRTGVLSAFVIPDQQTAIKSAIDQMQASHSALPVAESVAYRFSGIKPDELQRQIAGLAPRATVTVTPNRVLVTADVADQQVIREALAALDIQPVAIERTLRVFEVSQRSAEQVGTALRTFLPNSFVVSNPQTGSVLVRGSAEDLRLSQDIVDIWRQSQTTAGLELQSLELDRTATATWLATVQQIVPEAKVWLSEVQPGMSQHLMLLGSSEEIATIEKLLPQLLSVLPAADRRQLQIYPLTENQRARQSNLTPLPGDLADIKLVIGQGGQELLVWAAEEQHAAFARLLQQLDQPLSTTTLVPKSYRLSVDNTATVTQLLSAEFPGLQLTVNSAGDELTVLASPEQQAQIAQRVTEFNAELPARPQMLVESYAVEGMTAVTVQQALAPLLGNAHTTLDSQAERLLIRADAETHAELRELTTALGMKPDVGRQKVVIAYPLVHAQASNVKLLLDQIAREATVLADDKLRQVVVTGALPTQAMVKAAIDQIDRAGNAPPAAEIRSYDVGQLTASVLLPTLQAMWPQMQLTADSTTNQVVASGGPQEQEELKVALQQLTSAPGGDAQLAKTYAVPFGEMSTLPSILKQLAPRALISTDPVSRTVTVWAVEAQQKMVEQTLAALSQTARDAQLPATYVVKPTQLSAVQTSLQALFPTAVSAADSTTGQLIVVASEDIQQRVASVIELLSNGPHAAEHTTKVFQFDPLQVELKNVLVALQATLPAQVRLEANLANHTLLAIGSPEDLAKVSQQVEQLVAQLPAPEILRSVVYPLQHASPTAAVAVLTRLIPQSTLVPDVASKSISAAAKEEEHRTIAEFLTSFDQPAVNNKQTRVYRLRRSSGRGLSYVLTSLMPDATFYGSSDAGGLIATALPEQHERIAAIVEEFDIDRENTQTRVFAIGNGNATSLQNAIRNFAAEAAVSADTATNSLIVTATAEELKQIGEIIDQVEKGGSEPRTTRFYPVLGSEPVALSRALAESFPRVTLSADAASGGLFAAATASEHTELAKVIEELNAQPTRLPTLRAFVLQHASPQTVAAAIQDALGRRTAAGVSFNRETRSVFVVGSRDDLQVAQTLVEQIDVAGSNADVRKLRVFSLGGADGRSITDAIENLFQDTSAAVDVRYDALNGQLFVVGEPEQLTLVAEMLEQLALPDRQLEIVQLEATDPYSFKLAADALFEDEPARTAPSISIDSNQQRVMIRATPPQLASLRQLLQQMGETPLAGAGGSTARLRFIPIHRNSEKLLEEVRRLWPAAAGNSIEIIRPLDNTLPKPSLGPPPTSPQEPQPAPDGHPSPEQNGQQGQPEKVEPPAKLTSTPQSSPSDSPPPNNPISPGEIRHGAVSPALVSPALRPSAVSPAVPAVSPAVNSTAMSTAGEGASDSPALTAGATQDPPIVVVVGDEQWTLASADTQALDQFQRLLDSLLRPRIEPYATTGNYSVYLLRHAGAEQVQDLLEDLFRPERGRSTAISDLMQRVKIVADSRINAVIVSGNRQDRRTVEELLGVLDSEELLDSLQQITPTTLPLESASASQVEDILRDVYRSQLSSGAGRRPVAIPEGVSSDVASLLQQINAQSSGPLLTLAVDETSNSIVLRAPAELTAEISTFVKTLDTRSQQTPSKRVELIQLQSTNTKSLAQALKILLGK